MSRKLFLEFVEKSYGAIIGALLLGGALMLMSGCRTIAGKPAQAEETVRARSNQSADLTGKWYKTEGKFDYARYAENLGDFESLEITADGRVKSETLNAARSYDCIVEISTRGEGTINFSPDAQELNISLAAGQTRRTNNCSSANNSTGTTAATSANYRWKLAETQDGATELCLTESGGKTTCYRREN